MELEPKHCTKVKKCRGPTGAPGPTGEMGKQGPTGDIGPTGAPGEATIVAPTWSYGVLTVPFVTVNPASPTPIPFTNSLSSGNYFNSDGYFVPPVNGIYKFDVVINMQLLSISAINLRLDILNGINLVNTIYTNDNSSYIQISVPLTTTVSLTTNDQIVVSALSTSFIPIFGIFEPPTVYYNNATAFNAILLVQTS